MAEDISQLPGLPDETLPALFDAAGIPPFYATSEVARSYVLPSLITEFSDGEVLVPHPHPQDSLLQENFGPDRKFSGLLRNFLDDGDEEVKTQAKELVLYGADIFARQVVQQDTIMPPGPRERPVEIITKPAVSEHPATMLLKGLDAVPLKSVLFFDDQIVPLPKPAEIVVDYGPGIAGRHHILTQLQDMREGRFPYTYIGLSKGPFVNEFLQAYYGFKLQQAGLEALLPNVLGKTFIGYENGMGAGSTDLAVFFEQSGAAADLVIASAVHRAQRADIEMAINNAHRLLRAGGHLLIRGPRKTNLETPDSVPVEDMNYMAIRAGFDPSKAQVTNTTTGGDTATNIQSLAALFQK